MIHDERKLAKIIEELTMYFFSIGADRIQSGIEREGKKAIITFKANYCQDYKNELYYLDDYLNGPKNDSVEDVYWELAGSGNPGETSQLLLVGLMTDKAEIRMENDMVEIRLEKDLTK